MSGLLDGNIFESMSLTLPEHRMFQKQFEREMGKQTKPLLSEDQVAEIKRLSNSCDLIRRIWQQNARWTSCHTEWTVEVADC